MLCPARPGTPSVESVVLEPRLWRVTHCTHETVPPLVVRVENREILLSALDRVTDDEEAVNVDRYFEVELLDITARAETHQQSRIR